MQIEDLDMFHALPLLLEVKFILLEEKLLLIGATLCSRKLFEYSLVDHADRHIIIERF